MAGFVSPTSSSTAPTCVLPFLGSLLFMRVLLSQLPARLCTSMLPCGPLSQFDLQPCPLPRFLHPLAPKGNQLQM
ncbi:hypothetical protein EDB84DRAFT_1506524 [Lactarius hengduanensis]|nr:hypothetical protein EDB84DRAFT_1506524 [Lactarius hengduanensis]